MPKLQMWDMRNPFKYGFDPNNYGWIVPLVGIVDQTAAEEEEPEPEPESKEPEPPPSRPAEPSKPEPKPPAPPPKPAPSKPPAPAPSKPAEPSKPPALKPAPNPAPSKPAEPSTPPTITTPSLNVVEAQQKLKEAQEAEARAREEEEEKKKIAEEKRRIAEENQRIADADRLRVEEENKKNEETARLLAEELERKKEAEIIENERKLQEYLTARQQQADARKLAQLNAAEEERKKRVAEAEQARQLELEKDAAERARLHEFALQRLLAEKEQNRIAQEAAAVAEKARQEAAAREVERQAELKKREEELRLAQEQAAAAEAERDRMANIHKLKPEPSSTFTGSIADKQVQMEERQKYMDKQNEMSGKNLKRGSLARENWAPEVETVQLPPLVAPKPTVEKAAAVAAEQKRLSDERLRNAYFNQKNRVAEQKQKQKQTVKKKKPVIVLDAGHGGIDPGGVVPGVREKDIVLSFAKLLKGKIEAQGKYKAVLTRDKDVYVPLRDRFKIAEKADADMFISIHADKIHVKSIRGLTIYTLSEKASDDESAALAQQANRSDILVGHNVNEYDSVTSDILIDRALEATTEQSWRIAKLMVRSLKGQVPISRKPHRFAGFAVLKSPNVPSILIELGYLTNESDFKNLRSKNFKNNVSDKLILGIDAYFKELAGQ